MFTTTNLLRRILRTTTLCFAALFGAMLLAALAAIGHAHYLETEDRVAASPNGGFYVDAGDTRMFVQRIGDPAAPALVFIPGTGAWSGIWTPFMEQAAHMGYQAIAIDLPPFGYSVPPASGDYSKQAQARRILKTLDSLGLARASFVAHSIGSAPLLEALLAHPERVSRLILVAPALGLDQPQTDGSETRLQAVFRSPLVGLPLSAGLLANPAFTPWLIDLFVEEKDHVTPQWIALYRQPMVVKGYYQNAALWVPQLLASRGHSLSDDPLDLKILTCPVTLIWGTQDHVTPIEQGQHLQAWMPNAKLETLPGGHVPMVEEPERFMTLLSQALR